MTDIVSQIKSRVAPAAYDLATAEGRLAFDNALRAELTKIEDQWLSRHAAEMLKAWRRELFGMIDFPEIHQLTARLAAVEARLRIKAAAAVEMHDLQMGGEDG